MSSQVEKLQVLHAIAAALGATIERQAETEPGNYHVAWVYARLPEGLVDLHYNNGDRQGATINVSGEWPRDGKGQMVLPRDVTYKAPDVSINVSAKKSAEQIARDIRRRFLPEFATQYAKCMEIVESRSTFESAVERNYKELAAAGGGTAQKMQHRDGWYIQGLPEGVSVDYVSGDDVKLELRLSPADACALLRELAAKGAA